jgi:hypothetical protein
MATIMSQHGKISVMTKKLLRIFTFSYFEKFWHDRIKNISIIIQNTNRNHFTK